MSFWKWFSTKFHSHEWEVRQELPLKVYDSYDRERIIAHGLRYVLQCKICGEVKFKDCK